MRVQSSKMQATESDLKQLMADVSRAMEKAEQAVARIAGKAAAEADAAAPPQQVAAA